MKIDYSNNTDDSRKLSCMRSTDFLSGTDLEARE